MRDIREDVWAGRAVGRGCKEAEILLLAKGCRRSKRLYAPCVADTVVVLSCPSKQLQLVLSIHGCPLLSNHSIRTFVQNVKYVTTET
jgi:hypothetical protein